MASLVEEAEHLPASLLPARLLVVHDAVRRGEDNEPEETRGEQARDPLLDVGAADVVAGRDHAALVEAAVELDDDLARAVVVHVLKLVDVAWCFAVGCGVP